MYDTLGKYLRDYERERYTLFDRIGRIFALQSIILPPEPEQFADVSFWQAGMDWDKYPHRAAILRIGQNIWKDSSFETFYAACKQRGIAVGGYVFFDDRVTPQQQASMVSNAMLGKAMEMEIFVDVERSYGGAYGGFANIRKLIELLEAAGIRCKGLGIYTGYYYWKSLGALSASDSAFFAARPLWIAWYAAPSVVKVPPPWSDWRHWQYGTPVVQWGQPTAEIDANYYNGSRKAFESYYLNISQPPAGGDMHYYILKSNIEGEYRSIRAPHPTSHIQGAKIGQINPGASAKAVEKYVYGTDVIVNGTTYAKVGDIWWRVYEANGQPIDGWCAEVHLGKRYLIVQEVGTAQPSAPVSSMEIMLAPGSSVVVKRADGTTETYTA
jgi:GH25 family lysozyme M1 (1,4-beta-N-acetylmuramidase)